MKIQNSPTLSKKYIYIYIRVFSTSLALFTLYLHRQNCKKFNSKLVYLIVEIAWQ